MAKSLLEATLIRLACYLSLFLSLSMSSPASVRKTRKPKTMPAPGLSELQKMVSRFTPTPLRVDVSRVSQNDRQALAKLIEAGRILDDVFLKQFWEGNPALYARLQKDATTLGKARLHYFWINKSPWWRSTDSRPSFPASLRVNPKERIFIRRT
jgi:hypothetical protein